MDIITIKVRDKSDKKIFVIASEITRFFYLDKDDETIIILKDTEVYCKGNVTSDLCQIIRKCGGGGNIFNLNS